MHLMRLTEPDRKPCWDFSCGFHSLQVRPWGISKWRVSLVAELRPLCLPPRKKKGHLPTACQGTSLVQTEAMLSPFMHRQAQAAAAHLPGQESARLRALIDKHRAMQLHEQRRNSPQLILTPFPSCSAGLSSHLVDQQIKAHSLAKPHLCWQRPHVLLGRRLALEAVPGHVAGTVFSRMALVSASVASSFSNSGCSLWKIR